MTEQRSEHPAIKPDEIREVVRARYAAAATRSAAGEHERVRQLETSCCAGPGGGRSAVATTDAAGRSVFGAQLYDAAVAEGVPQAAVAASLGCGVPTAVAELRPGQVVLDLGSGAGADVLISARRVAPAGRVIGLDMTPEMLALAKANATAAGVDNVEFLHGFLEDIPLPDAAVDVVISNCVINLSADKPTVLREAARVLRPGGLFAVSDVIADPDMDEATRTDMQQWTGCVAGALTRQQFEQALRDAGLDGVEITETHRVHTRAAAAIIRARKSFGPTPPVEARADDPVEATSNECCSAVDQRACCAAADKDVCCGAATSSCGCR
jgi:arsenite methyltransferase